MTAAASLLASAEAFDLIGEPDNASQCRIWALHAETCPYGEALYRHFATQSAERATRKLREFHSSTEAGAANNKPPRIDA